MNVYKKKIILKNFLFLPDFNYFDLPTYLNDIDFVFIAGHGQQAEDGLIQSFLTLLKIPYTGTSALSSSLIMDKIASKSIIKEFCPVVKYLIQPKSYQEVIDEIKSDLIIIKPSCNGSSNGISIIEKKEDFELAIKNTKSIYDQNYRIICEEFLKDIKELQIGGFISNKNSKNYPELLLKDNLFQEKPIEQQNYYIQFSSIGEIILDTLFYDHDTKYSNDSKKK